jgi:ribulose-5-phosphate 4-epimerase/fuculose-1-phosphate aldolase
MHGLAPGFTSDQSKSDMTESEWATRCDLAAAFRMAHHLGWNDRTTNHITARLPDNPHHFLMNPRGLGWHEVTASCLVKADLDGNILSDLGEHKLGPAGFNFHSAILRANPHLHCSIHVHARPGVVISATKGGLVIVDQTGCHLHGEVAYHAFEGFAEEKDEAPRIIKDLGQKMTMIMWNHGLLSVGRTIGEAVLYMRRLVDACELQVQLMSTGAEIRRIPDDVLDFTRSQIQKKRQSPAYSDEEWKMYLRLVEGLDPSYRT